MVIYSLTVVSSNHSPIIDITENYDMNYSDYKECKTQGTFHFPIAFYHETPLTSGYLMPLHWHTQFEIIRIISGTFPLSVNNVTHSYQEGDVIFLMDGFLHGGNPVNCIYECIVFDLKILLKDNHACTKTIHDIINHRIMIHTHLSKDRPEITALVTNLCDSLSAQNTGYEFMTQGYLYQLLGTILSLHLYDEASPGRNSAAHLDSMKRVLSYISEHYNSAVSLNDLAGIAGMNPKYFCRYFRSMTERTPIDYLNYYRIECACEMLLTGNVTIKEASISCGFNDESYFIKTFHKYKGITPKQYMISHISG